MKTASARPRIVEAAGAGKVTQAFSLCASTENRLKACVTLPPRAGRGRELLFVMLAIAFLTLLASAGAQTPGTLDTGFNPIITNVVIATAVQPDGRIIIAGQFFTVNGTARNRSLGSMPMAVWTRASIPALVPTTTFTTSPYRLMGKCSLAALSPP